MSCVTGVWQVATVSRAGAPVADGRVSQLYRPLQRDTAQPWLWANFALASAEASVWWRRRHSS